MKSSHCSVQRSYTTRARLLALLAHSRASRSRPPAETTFSPSLEPPAPPLAPTATARAPPELLHRALALEQRPVLVAVLARAAVALALRVGLARAALLDRAPRSRRGRRLSRARGREQVAARVAREQLARLEVAREEPLGEDGLALCVERHRAARLGVLRDGHAVRVERRVDDRVAVQVEGEDELEGAEDEGRDAELQEGRGQRGRAAQ